MKLTLKAIVLSMLVMLAFQLNAQIVTMNIAKAKEPCQFNGNIVCEPELLDAGKGITRIEFFGVNQKQMEALYDQWNLQIDDSWRLNCETLKALEASVFASSDDSRYISYMGVLQSADEEGKVFVQIQVQKRNRRIRKNDRFRLFPASWFRAKPVLMEF